MSAGGRTGKVAWGDESIRMAAPTPMYLMAATVLPDSCDLSALAAIKPKQAGKLHWRELTDKLRARSLDVISGIGTSTTLVVAGPLPRKKQERGRRKCMEVLLPELEAKGIGTLVLKSRLLTLDRKDVEMLDVLRSKGAVTGVRVEHRHADEMPELWIPDQILGAYGDIACSSEGAEKWRAPWEKIADGVTVRNVSL